MIAGRFAAVLGVLLAAHDLADHVVQTDHQAATKASDWRGMAGHVGGYGVTQAVALGALHGAGVRLTFARALAGLAVSLGSHAFLDRRWPVVELLRRTGSGRFAEPLVRVAETAETNERRRIDRLRATTWSAAQAEGRTITEAHAQVNALPKPPAASDALVGPLPLHGPYLADQALHHVCVALAAAVIAGGAS